MMVHLGRFLTPAWLAELGEAAAGDQRLRDATRGISLTIGHQVAGGPDGDVSFRMRFADGEVTVEPGPGDAEIVVHQSYETAAAVNRGELAPVDAFAAGLIRVGGRPGILSRYREAMAPLGDVFRCLREGTTY